VTALPYDDLPEGSELRREFDGRGGVTITAPAGEVSAAGRRWLAASAFLPACAACAACVLVGSAVLHAAIRSNRLDPSLRVAAFAGLAALAAGFFLFGWWGEYALRLSAMAEARRQSTMLHADARRLLVERAGTVQPSLDIPTSDIESLRVVVEPVVVAGRLRSPRVPFLKVSLRDGSSHLLLGGHHLAELRWVAAAVAQGTGAKDVRE
jgi:hypothetical protein